MVAKQFAGYTDITQVGETRRSVTYSARPEGKDYPVIIKAFRVDYPTEAETARFRHEYELIRAISLVVDGVVRVVDIIDAGGRLAVVLEDFGGVPLREFIRAGFSTERFLELAISIAEIVGKVHQHNISHRDIRPQNIIVDYKGDAVRITGFGIASEITRIREEIYNPEVIQGMLAYMSPEQTGRMNCAVDYRTDLYSLGVTFYEMLTGRVPFLSSDSMEIIHSHIARMPARPDTLNPEVPAPLGDIIMKLLSKAPADRYQNCFGLAADLRQCLDRVRAAGTAAPFELGQADISLRFIIPQILVGRDRELDLLHSAFSRVSRGGIEAVLVTGEPGIGKSALVNEIHKPIAEKRGYFIAGKYDQFRRDVPYSSIIQAFQGLARQILSESEERVSAWKERILRALGPNGRIITDVIPDIELIIGRQPDVPEVSPEESQNRFNLFFKNFVQVFADKEHPLVLFLDDLQWADIASLNLVRTITTDRSLRYFLFMGAYRDTEVEAHHSLMLTLDEMRKAGLKVGTTTLGVLNADDVNEFISYFLRCDADASRPLSRIIHAKTRGNPFFVNQFLKNLYEGRLIAFEPGRGWSWDLKNIQDLQVTDNVVEFLAGRLRYLPEEPLDLIKVCSCVGNRFDVITLAAVTSRPVEEIFINLDLLIREGLINRRDEQYRFHHDRIEEAAYSLLTQEDRDSMHYHIGTLALRNTSPEDLVNSIFYIVDQMNQGRGLIADEGERIALAGLNEKAGAKAKESTAYKAAVNYFKQGLSLLPEHAWQSHYELAYTLHLGLMECEYLDRNFSEAEKLFDEILGNAANNIDRARAYSVMVVLYTDSRPAIEAVSLGLRALKLFNINIPLDMGSLPVTREYLKVKLALRKIPLEKISGLPDMKDRESVILFNLLTAIGTPAYYVNTNIFAYVSLYAANNILKYGHTPNSSVIFMALACIVQVAEGDYETGYRIGEIALKLHERADRNPHTPGMVPHMFAIFIQHWKKHARHNADVYKKVYEISINAGDFIYAGLAVSALAATRIGIGDRLDDIYDELEKYRGLMEIIKDPVVLATCKEHVRYIKAQKGLTPKRYSMDGDGFDHDREIEQLKAEKNFFALCGTQMYKTRLLCQYGKFKEALETAADLDTHIRLRTGMLYVPLHYFNYSLVLTGLLFGGEKKLRRQYLGLVKRNQKQLKIFSGLCPENFRHKYDLVRAELAALKGRFEDAVRLYHEAILGARRNGYLHEEALACELIALFYIRLNCRDEASVFMNTACDCYARWGASAKEQDLRERYPDLLGARAGDGTGDTVSSVSTSDLLDLSTIMQASQVISSEIMLERLLQKIMHMSITNAGAQRGYLLLEEEGRLTIEASEDVDSGENSVMQSVPVEECDDLSRAVVNYVFHSGKPLILGNAMAEGTFMNDPYIVRGRCKSILCSPILSQGKLSGILYMENNLAENAFTPERLELLRIISVQAAISLENAKLFELATTDGMTKLFVHRYFQLLLDSEIQRSRRYSRPFTLAMVDIDNFKKFNDMYGHQLGDEVLKQAARAIRKSTRPVDISARYGGEEFVIVFPETSVEQAMVAAEKVRAAVERISIPFENRNLGVTVSIGLAEFPRHARTKDDLIRYADAGLYASKREGKNRISVGGKIEPGISS
ncbi:MAG TPA: diguanylate cyclase [Spirochaetota bacterium]|nr:diguanylate cyclase [Spirochaetota bacterium]HPI89322.1 diguanylate cyclase [Spirochaetota bacterium]HPR49239.1 diguanylate cyclase [Spirochaetota bacterium]